MLEEIRTRAGVATGSESIGETRQRWLGHVESKTEQCERRDRDG